MPIQFAPKDMWGGLANIDFGALMEPIFQKLNYRTSLPGRRETQEKNDPTTFTQDTTALPTPGSTLGMRQGLMKNGFAISGATNGRPEYWWGAPGTEPEGSVRGKYTGSALLNNMQTQQSIPDMVALWQALQNMQGPTVADQRYDALRLPQVAGQQMPRFEAGGQVQGGGDIMGLLRQLLQLDRGEVPIIAHEGEAVLNRNAAQMVGPQQIAALNVAGGAPPNSQGQPPISQGIPRFAPGGIVTGSRPVLESAAALVQKMLSQGRPQAEIDTALRALGITMADVQKIISPQATPPATLGARLSMQGDRNPADPAQGQIGLPPVFNESATPADFNPFTTYPPENTVGEGPFNFLPTAITGAPPPAAAQAFSEPAGGGMIPTPPMGAPAPTRGAPVGVPSVPGQPPEVQATEQSIGRQQPEGFNMRWHGNPLPIDWEKLRGMDNLSAMQELQRLANTQGFAPVQYAGGAMPSQDLFAALLGQLKTGAEVGTEMERPASLRAGTAGQTAVTEAQTIDNKRQGALDASGDWLRAQKAGLDLTNAQVAQTVANTQFLQRKEQEYDKYLAAFGKSGSTTMSVTNVKDAEALRDTAIKTSTAIEDNLLNLLKIDTRNKQVKLMLEKQMLKTYLLQNEIARAMEPAELLRVFANSAFSRKSTLTVADVEAVMGQVVTEAMGRQLNVQAPGGMTIEDFQALMDQ